MADTKISALTAITGANLATGDIFPLADVSASTTKGITAEQLKIGLGTPRGALVTRSGDLTTQNYSGAATPILFNSETGGYDTDSIHDTGSNTSKLFVPSGWSYVRLTASVHLNLVTAGNWIATAITKNGADAVGMPKLYVNMSDTATNPAHALVSAIVAVVGGTDYFELTVQCQDTSITVLSTSWFAMDLIA